MKTEKSNSRFRTIIKYGNSFVLIITRSDMKDLKLKEGDSLDISDCLIVKSRKKKK